MDGMVASVFTEDARQLRAAAEGDAEAFGWLYETHARGMFSLALRLCADRALAEDVVQESFVKALSAARSYRGEAPLRAWLKRLTANAAVDRLRAEGRQERLEAPEPAGLASADTLHECLGLLERLDSACRTVVWLNLMEGYSHPEIGAMHGKSESWSKMTMARGLSRLRQSLEEESDGRASR